MFNQFLSTRTFRNLSLISLTTLTLSSCEKTESTPAQPYDDGVIVVNEGNFSTNDGSLSLVARDSKTASLDIFFKENNRSLGGGVAGYAEIDEKGIVLVDNSSDGKDALEIVNARTFKSIASIKGEIDNPRRIVKAGTNKAYITCWDTFNSDYSYKTGFVAVLDLTTNKILKKIPVDKGAESIVVIGTNAYVGNVGNQKTIKVIDTQKDEVTASIEVGENPNVVGLDANNKLWIYTNDSAKEIGSLNKFNISTKTIESGLEISTKLKGFSNIIFNSDKTIMFFEYSRYNTNGEIFSLNINDTKITTTSPLIKRKFTGLGFDTESNLLYAGVTPSYKQAGYVLRYSPTGNLIDSVKVEIAPSKFYFK